MVDFGLVVLLASTSPCLQTSALPQWGGNDLHVTPDDIAKAKAGDPAASRLLIRAALAREPEAMRALVDLLLPVIQTEVAFALRRRALPRRRNARQDVEDFVQEVFIELLTRDAKALRDWDAKRGRTLPNFVRLVARRRVARLFRGHRGNPWKDDPTEAADFDYLAPPDRSSEAQLDNRRRLSEIYEVLQSRLSDRGLVLFELIYLEQRSVKEVCEVMGMSRAAVDTWNSRLRKLVRSLTEG